MNCKDSGKKDKRQKGSYNRIRRKASHTAKHVEEESQTNQSTEKVMDIPAQDSLKQSVDKPTKQAHTERAAAKTQVGIEKTADAVQSDDFKDKKSYGDSRAQRGRRKADIVEKFLSQPPVIVEKDKAESGKGSGGRFSDQGRDRSRRNKKDLWEDNINYNLLSRKNKKSKKGKDVKPAAPPPERKKAITMGDIITVKELSEKIGIQVAEIIKKLMSLGILATINQELDYDTAYLIASNSILNWKEKQ